MKKKAIYSIVGLFLTMTLFAQQAQLTQEQILKNIDEYAAQVREDWKIPGMSLSVIKDGELIFAKGYGVKDLGTGIPVDESTLYQVGSVSKSFTAAVVASLVDEGKLKWTDTVKNILPDFELYDKWVEQNLLVKDMMTHKTGIGGQVGTYIPNLGYSRDDVYRMLPLIKPSYSFRDKYEYNNITFIIASKVIEKVSGKSWEENVRERLLIPIGMSETTLNGEGFKEAYDRGDAQTPHAFWFANDSINVEAYYGVDQALHWLTAIGPAGSVISNVTDMAKWTQFHLDNGLVAGKEVISKKNMDYLHTGITITSQDSARTTLYGHCWFVEQNSRYRLYFHTGTTWGQTALCFFMPELNLGGMILVNSEAYASPRYAIMRRLIDMYKGFPEKDYNAEYLADFYKSERDAEERRKNREKPAEEPAPKYKALAGKYEKDELFGNAEVTLEKDDLYIVIGKYGWKHMMKHVNGNKFSFWSDGHEFPITFKLNEKGDKAVSFEIDFNYKEDFGPWVRK